MCNECHVHIDMDFPVFTEPNSSTKKKVNNVRDYCPDLHLAFSMFLVHTAVVLSILVPRVIISSGLHGLSSEHT
jgi:hypothetical protein